MKTRTIELAGHKVDLYDFGYKQFLYPQFNGNAEFEVSARGFRKLSTYLRSINWVEKIMQYGRTKNFV